MEPSNDIFRSQDKNTIEIKINQPKTVKRTTTNTDNKNIGEGIPLSARPSIEAVKNLSIQ